MLPIPPNGYLKKETAAQDLRNFVDAGDFDMPAKLPKRANPEQTSLFAAYALRSDVLIDRQVTRIGQLMRFFDLRNEADGLLHVLNRKVIEADDWERAATAVAVLGDMGTTEQTAAALHYYKYLSNHPAMQLKRMIDIFFHLPPEADASPIDEYIDHRMKELSPKIDQSDDALIEYYELQDLKEDRLPSVLKAKQYKHDVHKIDERKKKNQQALRCYLRHETNPYVDLAEWGLMMLQRDCNENDVIEMAHFCAESFDIIQDRGQKMAPLSDDDKEDESAYVTRCIHAIEFYGGSMSESQQQYAQSRLNDQQVDPLQWETPVAGLV
jgi:hypothetical protein